MSVVSTSISSDTKNQATPKGREAVGQAFDLAGDLGRGAVLPCAAATLAHRRVAAVVLAGDSRQLRGRVRCGVGLGHRSPLLLLERSLSLALDSAS